MIQYLIIAAIVVWALFYCVLRLKQPGDCGACSACRGCGKSATPEARVVPPARSPRPE